MLGKSFTRKWIAAFIILCMGLVITSCTAGRREDTKPPSAPLLTVSSVSKDAVVLAWSESYDDKGIENYRLYRDGEVLAKVTKTQYTDEEVEVGSQYEYYVVAYDESGNKSAKSVKQNVTVEDKDNPENKQGKQSGDLDLNKLAKSTIRLYLLDDDYNIIGTGSGTIIDNQGRILTNFHCVGTEDGQLNNKDGVVAIALTDDVRVSSQPQYLAQFRAGVQALDLAVVQIVGDLNGNEIDGSDLDLSPIDIADSDAVNMGDGINILGYPGVGGETITFTSGKVSGFIDEDYDNEVDWIKTDAVVNHGNSGGTAINDKGEMIGIPTAKQTGEDNDIMFYLKPVNQALDIIDDAIAHGNDPDLPDRPDPTPTPANPDPVKPDPGDNANTIDIYGRIIDSLTGEPLAKALFVIFQPGVTIEDFYNNPQDSMILAMGESDQDGLFDCPGVPVGQTYSVMVAADGYYPIAEDDALELPSDLNEAIDLGDVSLEPEE